MGSWSYDTTCSNCGNKEAYGWGDKDGSKGEECNQCGIYWYVSFNGRNYDSYNGWMTLDEVNENRANSCEPNLKKLKQGRYDWGM